MFKFNTIEVKKMLQRKRMEKQHLQLLMLVEKGKRKTHQKFKRKIKMASQNPISVSKTISRLEKVVK